MFGLGGVYMPVVSGGRAPAWEGFPASPSLCAMLSPSCLSKSQPRSLSKPQTIWFHFAGERQRVQIWFHLGFPCLGYGLLRVSCCYCNSIVGQWVARFPFETNLQLCLAKLLLPIN